MPWQKPSSSWRGKNEVPIYENAELVKLLARMELGDSIPEGVVPHHRRDHCVCLDLEGQVPGGL